MPKSQVKAPNKTWRKVRTKDGRVLYVAIVRKKKGT